MRYLNVLIAPHGGRVKTAITTVAGITKITGGALLFSAGFVLNLGGKDYSRHGVLSSTRPPR